MFVLAVFVITQVPRVYTYECPLFLLVLFRAGGKTPDPKLQVRSYVDVMLEQNLSKEEVSSYLVFSLTWTKNCRQYLLCFKKKKPQKNVTFIPQLIQLILMFVHICM